MLTPQEVSAKDERLKHRNMDRDRRMADELAVRQGKMQDVREYAREIERQLAEYRNWDIEADRYQFTEPYPGTFVYTRKTPLDPNEPMHYLCPKCFQKRQKSFLQDGGPHGITRRCHECEIAYQFRPYPQRESGGCY